MDAGSRIKSWREEVMEFSCTFAGLWKDRKRAMKAKQMERLAIRRTVFVSAFMLIRAWCHTVLPVGGISLFAIIIIIIIIINLKYEIKTKKK
jgi:hypothetical protein